VEIKIYKSGDETQILALFKKVFKRDLSLEFWNWRFTNNPFGNRKISLMWDNEKLVGHYAVSPVDFLNGEKKIKTALSMTTMTDPDYGGRGIFGKLAKDLYDKLLLDNYKIVWGFPNNNSHYAFINKLNWSDIGVCHEIAGDLNLSSSESSYVFNRINIFSEKHSEFIIYGDKFQHKIFKSCTYLNWRYINNPSESYLAFEVIVDNKIKGIIVAKKYGNKLNILELTCEINAEIISNMLKDLGMSLFPANKNIEISLWLSLFDEKYPIFEKLGFIPSGNLTYLGFKALGENNKEQLHLRDWSYQFGDSDVY
jgi:hypothetical protein